MKKYSIIIVFILIFTLLSACSGTNNNPQNATTTTSTQPVNTEGTQVTQEPLPENFNLEGFPIVNERIQLSMMGSKAPTHGEWEDMVFFKEMENLSNIHFNITTVPKASFEERKNIAFATGEYPDVFFGQSMQASDEMTYGAQGILIPLEELIRKYAPNIQRLLDENPHIKKSITTPDGHIYALPGLIEGHSLVNKVWLNGKWLEQLNITELPTNTDEFYQLLKNFRDNDANGNGEMDEIPLSAPTMEQLRKPILAQFGLLSDINHVEEIDGVVRYNPIHDNYREYLTFMNKLNVEKLLDQEIFIHTTAQFRAKGNSELVGAFVTAAPFNALKLKNDEENRTHPALPALTSSMNNTKMALLNSDANRGVFSITDKNKNPEATIRWVDYLFTVEGTILAKFGDGLVWNEDKTLWSFEAPEGQNKDQYRGTLCPDPGLPLPVGIDKEFFAKENNLVKAYLNEVTEKEFIPYARAAFPLTYFTKEEQSRINILQNDITTYVEQMEAKFIVGNEPLSGWDNYVSTIKKMGVDEMIEIYQASYDRWNQ